MKQWTDANWQSRFDIVYKCRLSALYHRKRERFFGLLDKLTAAFALIAGAGAMTDLLHTADNKAIAGAIVVAVTLPSIVFSWAERSRTFALLAAKFISLEAEIESAGILDALALDKLKSKALLLDMEEPPQLSALTRICQNEISFADGHLANITKLSFWEKHFAQWFDMPAKSESLSTSLNATDPARAFLH
jgi:hypothetical protein